MTKTHQNVEKKKITNYWKAISLFPYYQTVYPTDAFHFPMLPGEVTQLLSNEKPSVDVLLITPQRRSTIGWPKVFLRAVSGRQEDEKPVDVVTDF